MGKIHRITESEKELLHVLRRTTDMTTKELLENTEYKWERTIGRKLKKLKEQRILYGPFYNIDHSKLCKNPLHKLLCIVETHRSYETVIQYLQLIESVKWTYPVLPPHKNMLNVAFFSSDDAAITNILQILKKNDIITDYSVRVICSRMMIENPNLYGDFNPSLHSLLDPCDIPDMSLQYYDTAWNECDLRILPYIERGTKLIEILRKEKKLHRTWTYDQMRYSREKMIKNGLIEKKYFYYPFPPGQCTHFELFLKTENIKLTQRIMYNFARNGRVHKKYILCEDWGFIACTSHPLFLKDLMHNLDRIDEITEKEVYQTREFPYGKYFFRRFPDLKYYDFETQTLEYPYRVYEEQIKEKIESKNF